MNLCFFCFFLRYQMLAYPLHKKVSGDATTCGKILTKSKVENWLMGRTKVFLKYYHVEELARLLELHRRKVVTLQTGWFVFQARVLLLRQSNLCCFKITFLFCHRLLSSPRNRLFPSYLVPLFQNASLCIIFHMKMSLICMEMNL